MRLLCIRTYRFSTASTGAVTAAIAIAASATPAMAQNDTAAAANDGVADIVVTAQRREEGLQTTALAISAANEEMLREQNVESLQDIAFIAPNVLVGSQSLTGGLNGGFFIRGIGQDRSGITFDQGVGVYVDGLYQSRSDSNFLSIVDVERIEVLRGPQGTLFGKNTIGGAIRYITKQPGPDFEGYVDGTIGSFDRLDVKGSINVPLSDALFMKATFGALEREGHVKHVVDEDRDGDTNVRVGRLQLRALASDRLTIDLDASKTVSKNSGRAFIVDYIDPADLFPTAFRTKTGLPFDERFESPDPYTRYGGDNTRYRYEGYNLAGTISYQLSDSVELKSITGYGNAKVFSANDWDGTEFPVYDIINNRKFDQFSEELQLSGEALDGGLDFVLGGFYMKEDAEDDSSVLSAFDGTFDPDDYTIRRPGMQAQTVESYAAFAQATLSLGEILALTGGLRYSEDKKEATNGTATLDGSWSDVSPRVAIEAQWSDEIMTYASVTKGFRSGGINIGRGGLSTYDPETVWNYEAGIRTDLFDRMVRFNLTGFYMQYKDQQLTAIDLSNPTSSPFIQNVGKGDRTGFEIETVIAPFTGLTLNGNLGYLDAEYDDIGSATDVSLDSVVLRSPKWTYTVGGAYEIPVGDGSVTTSLNYNYRSKQSTTSSDGNTVLLDGYGLLNARIQYNAPGDQWELALFATNLTDELYYIGGFDFARRENAIGISQLDVGRPREIGLSLRFNF